MGIIVLFLLMDKLAVASPILWKVKMGLKKAFYNLVFVISLIKKMKTIKLSKLQYLYPILKSIMRKLEIY